MSKAYIVMISRGLAQIIAISILLSGALAQVVFASVTGKDGSSCKVTISYDNPLHLNISSMGMNRISFAPNIVTTIWGDAGEYGATLSDNGSELFITSRVEAGNNIALILQLAGGRVIDLILHTIDDKESRIINLVLKDTETRLQREQQEVMKLFNAMRSGIKGKYYVKALPAQFTIGGNKHLIARQERLYRFGDLMGLPLKIKNTGKKTVSVNSATLLAKFRNLLAIQAEDVILTSGQEMQAFLVVREARK